MAPIVIEQLNDMTEGDLQYIKEVMPGVLTPEAEDWLGEPVKGCVHDWKGNLWQNITPSGGVMFVQCQTCAYAYIDNFYDGRYHLDS